jgi:hypothetical protein
MAAIQQGPRRGVSVQGDDGAGLRPRARLAIYEPNYEYGLNGTKSLLAYLYRSDLSAYIVGRTIGTTICDLSGPPFP